MRRIVWHWYVSGSDLHWVYDSVCICQCVTLSGQPVCQCLTISVDLFVHPYVSWLSL